MELIQASDRSDLIARLSTSISGGSPPDLFLMNYRFYGQFASKGAIEPVGDRLSESDEFDADDFYPEALDAFRWQDEQLCLPQNISSLVVYYNRTLFRRHGIPEPKDDWTFGDLVALAPGCPRRERKSIAAGDPIREGEGRSTGQDRPTLIRAAILWANGRSSSTPGAADHADARHSRWARGAGGALLAEKSARRDPVRHRGRVRGRRVALRERPARDAALVAALDTDVRTIEDFDWDIAPLPRFRERAGILHSDAYCLTSDSKHHDAAWEFVEFALGVEGQTIVAKTGRTVPSLVEVSRSPAFLDPTQPPKRAQVFLDAIPTIRRVPTISTWPEIEDAAEGILENGLYLSQPPEEVARELERVTKPLFARGETG